MEKTAQTIQASKEFNKSVQKLYDAWINADKLKQWWQPAGNQLVNVENQVKEGGTIVYDFETTEGNKAFSITGEYEEVEPEAKLVYTWNWKLHGNPEAKENHFELTVEFKSEGDKSSIHITQSDLDNHETLHPTTKGWDEELERLSQFLS